MSLLNSDQLLARRDDTTYALEIGTLRSEVLSAPDYPGYRWTCVDASQGYVGNGEFFFKQDTLEFWISGITADGMVLVDQQSAYNEFASEAAMTFYEASDSGQSVRLRAATRMSHHRVQAYGGRNYFRIKRGGYGKQNLTLGKDYWIAAPGLW